MNSDEGPLETEGYVCPTKSAPLELRKVMLPPLLPTQIEVQMIMVGLCHTDLHMHNNDWGTSDYPLLPGHEGVAIVTKRGSQVESPVVGARVAIGWMRDSCKTRGMCEAERENLCAAGYQGTYLGASAGIWGASSEGYNKMGGCFARVQRIEARFAAPIPDAIPNEVVCPLICGGGTVYEPLVVYGFLGAVIGVSSVGGLGTAAIKLARLRKYRVVAISSSAWKRDAAISAGAERFVCVTDEEAMEEIKGTIDVLIETSPMSSDVGKYMKCLKINGTYVRVGIPSVDADNFSAHFIPMIFQQQRIAGSIITGMRNMKEMLQLVAGDVSGVMDKEEWKTQHLKMEEVNEAIDMLLNRKNKGYRFVLEW